MLVVLSESYGPEAYGNCKSVTGGSGESEKPLFWAMHEKGQGDAFELGTYDDSL
jgi:hypothetical protein